MTVVNTSDHTNVVGVASGIGVVLGKSVSDLAEGVSISISISISVSLSLTLAVEVSTVARVANVSTNVSTISRVADVSSRVSTVVSTVANSAVAGDTSMAVVNT